MPANTPKGFPYPLPTEPVAEGAAAIRLLAEAVDTKLGELAFVERTSPLNVTATTALTAVEVIAAPAVVIAAANPRVLVEFVGGLVTPATSGSFLILTLWDALDGAAAVTLGRFIELNTPAAANHYAHQYGARRLAPAPGSHVYSIRAFVTAGNGTVAAGAGGADPARPPAFLRITQA